MVASLPEHAHLFSDPGCYDGRDDNGIKNRPCLTEKNESPLPKDYEALELTPEQDTAWLKAVNASLEAVKKEQEGGRRQRKQRQRQ